MATIIQTVTENYIYDDEFSLYKNTQFPVEFKTNKLYQIMIQMNPSGQLGYGFIRIDTGVLPVKDTITFNRDLILSSGEMNEKSNFAKLFKDAKLKESARASNLVLPQ
jgi:hypothetical protein